MDNFYRYIMSPSNIQPLTSNFKPGQRITYEQPYNGMVRRFAGRVVRVASKRVVVKIKTLGGNYVVRSIAPRNLKLYQPKGHRR